MSCECLQTWYQPNCHLIRTGRRPLWTYQSTSIKICKYFLPFWESTYLYLPLEFSVHTNMNQFHIEKTDFIPHIEVRHSGTDNPWLGFLVQDIPIFSHQSMIFWTFPISKCSNFQSMLYQTIAKKSIVNTLLNLSHQLMLQLKVNAVLNLSYQSMPYWTFHWSCSRGPE